MQTKQHIRDAVLPNRESRKSRSLPPGILAEKIRKITGYKEARQLFVAPGGNLSQVRINALLDGKELIMPAPGLKDGFFLLKPYSIPFRQVAFAVVYKGLAQFGRRLQQDDLAALRIDLLVTDALAVGPDGYFLGEGEGYFDLAYAILQSAGGLAADHRIVVVADNEPGEENFEPDPWDIQADIILTGGGVKSVDQSDRFPKQGEILWTHLPLKRIKKITPLWKLHNQQAVGKSSR